MIPILAARKPVKASQICVNTELELQRWCEAYWNMNTVNSGGYESIIMCVKSACFDLIAHHFLSRSRPLIHPWHFPDTRLWSSLSRAFFHSPSQPWCTAWSAKASTQIISWNFAIVQIWLWGLSLCQDENFLWNSINSITSRVTFVTYAMTICAKIILSPRPKAKWKNSPPCFVQEPVLKPVAFGVIDVRLVCQKI